MFILTTNKKYERHYSYNLIAVTPMLTSEFSEDPEEYITYTNPQVDINITTCFRFLETIKEPELKNEFLNHIEFFKNYNFILNEWQDNEDLEDVKKFHDENIVFLKIYMGEIAKKFNIHYYIDEYYFNNKDESENYGKLETDDEDSILVPFDDTNYIDYFSSLK